MATTLRPLASALALAATMAAAPTLHAAGFGDMFNPGRWFGGNNNDDYYDGPYGGGPYGAPGYGGYGVPGYGAYGVPGYGYGYGAVPYGYAPGVAPGVVPGVAPGYAAPAVAPAPAAGSEDAKDQEIEALKRRIDQLESRQSAPPPGSSGAEGWPSAPAFRPMDQY